MRLSIVLVAVVAISGLNGCRARAGAGQASASPAPQATATPGDALTKVDSVVESKNLANEDESFDLAFVQEKQETYQLSPEATVRVVGINGKIEIQKSTTDNAELYMVRSVADREDFKSRALVVESRPDELVIRVKRVRRSTLFAMFSDPGREKQRLILKLPRKVDLTIDGVNGRVNVVEVDGAINIESINGRVALAKVSGMTSVSGVNGQVRVIADGRNKNDLKVEGIKGGVELLFTGTVNADLRVEAVQGNVDPDLPNLVYDGERRQNNFRARVGKGGAIVEISGVRGKVRLAPASEQDLASATTASSKPGAPSDRHEK